jgi:hypothetical protein
MNNSQSQSGQDLFVLKLIKNKKPYFVDIGCWKPIEINNTFLLENNGWSGVSIDILDLTSEWSIIKTNFVKANALELDYTTLFNENNLPKIIDYLTIDIEGDGHRFLTLKKVLESDRDFKIITIEHDSYLGDNYELNEKIPQREILKKYGYKLICSDVSQEKNPDLYYEDWWVNEKYFDEKNIKSWASDKLSCDKIFNKNNIKYTVNDETRQWKKW